MTLLLGRSTLAAATAALSPPSYSPVLALHGHTDKPHSVGGDLAVLLCAGRVPAIKALALVRTTPLPPSRLCGTILHGLVSSRRPLRRFHSLKMVLFMRFSSGSHVLSWCP